MTGYEMRTNVAVEMTTFQTLVGSFIGTVDKLSKAVEAEKLKVNLHTPRL